MQHDDDCQLLVVYDFLAAWVCENCQNFQLNPWMQQGFSVQPYACNIYALWVSGKVMDTEIAKIVNNCYPLACNDAFFGKLICTKHDQIQITFPSTHIFYEFHIWSDLTHLKWQFIRTPSFPNVVGWELLFQVPISSMNLTYPFVERQGSNPSMRTYRLVLKL